MMIEFDALTDHGNSGGPLFDASTGLVWGVVTLGIQSQTSEAVQNNLAIDTTSIHEFLMDANVPYHYKTGIQCWYTPALGEDCNVSSDDQSGQR